MNKPITLCDRCDNAFHCLLNYDGKSCRNNRTVEPTNADRIRAMTDEELAEWLDNNDSNFPISDGGEHWLSWLKSPVEVDA